MSKKEKGTEKSLWRLAVTLAKTGLINATKKTSKKDDEIQTPMMDHREDDRRYWASYDLNRFSGGGMATGEVAYGSTASYSISVDAPSRGPEAKISDCVPITPKQALAELGRMPTHFSLEGLDDKISMFESKRDMITQRYAVDDVERMLTCLRNRKKYDLPMSDGQTPRQFFGLFDATTHDMIEALLARHKHLVMKEAEIFIPEFPQEATETMAAYTTKCEELTGKKPKFYVIATESAFREADKKRDPILVAPSPFFFGYHILGAWDEEMLYLPEL